MRQTAVVAAIWVLGLIVARAAYADSEVCSYDPGSHTATMTVTPGDFLATSIGAGPNGVIFASGSQGGGPCGAATTANTDTVVVNNASASQKLSSIVYVSPSLAPGFTDEPGGTDEIELLVNLGAGGGFLAWRRGDQKTVPVNTALGGNQINFDAGEGEGIDADVTLAGKIRGVLVPQSAVRDTINGAGGSGTPSTPFAFRISTDGSSTGQPQTGPGDLLIGGGNGDFLVAQETNDLLIGGSGRDILKGVGGADLISGKSGRDEMYGGPAKDKLIGAAGKDVVFGGAALDRIFGGAANDRLLGQGGVDFINGQEGQKDECSGPPDHRKNCEFLP